MRAFDLAILALCLLFQALPSLGILSEEAEERLIGWRGDSFKPHHTDSTKGPWIEQISWKPRASILHNIISDSEAQHLIDLAWPIMQRSEVEGTNESEGGVDDYRTSYGTFLSRFQDKVVESIERRVANILRVPVHHQEDLQVLRYGEGQYYHEHTDSLDDDSPRMATLLIYLHDPIEGGETSFPSQKSGWANSEAGTKYGTSFSECAQGHVAFKPRRGDGLLFWSIHPDGKTEDPLSSHEGCPVVQGTKWTATLWTHTLPFRPEEWNGTSFNAEASNLLDPGFCQDAEERCPEWATSGECEENPEYMKGNSSDGSCRKSCKVCELCSENDIKCYNRNRAAAGYLAFNSTDMRWYSESGATEPKWN
eukprot:gene1614-33003_t